MFCDVGPQEFSTMWRTVDIANNWFLQCAETSMASHIQKQEQIESLTVEFRFTNYASLFILKNVVFSKAPVWALCLGLVGSSNQILSTSIPFNAAQQFNVTFRGGLVEYTMFAYILQFIRIFAV